MLQFIKTEESCASMNSLPLEILSIVLSDYQCTEESYFVSCVCKLWNLLIRKRGFRVREIINYYAQHGTLDSLKLIRKIVRNDEKFLLPSIFQYATKPVFSWLLPSLKCPQTSVVQSVVAGSGLGNHWGRIKLLCNTVARCYIGNIQAETFRCAAQFGNLELVRSLYCEKKVLWDAQAAQLAAKNGHLEVLKWCKENVSEWQRNNQVSYEAAKEGHLDIVKWFYKNEGCLDSSTTAAAAINGHLDIIKYCRKKNCNWDIQATENAAEGGHLEVLRWVVENGCPLGARTTDMAVYGGHLDVLKYCKSVRRFVWNLTKLAESAAYRGHLEILKWLVKIFPIKLYQLDSALNAACHEGKLDIVRWLIDHGVEVTGEATNSAYNGNSFIVFKWLMDNSYPWHRRALFTKSHALLDKYCQSCNKHFK